MTFLFDGEMLHRDSLGTELSIKPGEVNLMTAGRGIVHSERTAPERRMDGQNLFGIQSWMALPKSHEELEPSFTHHTTADLPRLEGEGKRVSIILGSLYGATSPANFPHATFYAEAVLAPGAILPLDPDYDERAVYIVSERVDIAGQTFEPWSNRSCSSRAIAFPFWRKRMRG